jgi:hypothetical protein
MPANSSSTSFLSSQVFPRWRSRLTLCPRHRPYLYLQPYLFLRARTIPPDVTTCLEISCDLLSGFRSRPATLSSSHASVRSRRLLRSAGKAPTRLLFASRSISSRRCLKACGSSISYNSGPPLEKFLASYLCQARFYKLRRFKRPTVGIGTTKCTTVLEFHSRLRIGSPTFVRFPMSRS